MYQFDINYTNKEYMEYYKYVLITRKIIRTIIFMALFIAIAIIWWVDPTKKTSGNFIPIFSLAFSIIVPLSNLIYIPLLKRQLKLRDAEVKSIKIGLTFTDQEIIYENLTIPVQAEENTPSETTDIEEDKKEETVPNENANEVLQEEESQYEQEEPQPEPQRTFTLHYNNFYEVTATKNLVMMSLDHQTVIIIPKRTITVGTIDEFITFLASKIPARRFKIKGVKSTYQAENPSFDEVEKSEPEQTNSVDSKEIVKEDGEEKKDHPQE